MIIIPGNVNNVFEIFSKITQFEIAKTFIDWKKQNVISFDFVTQ